ncbi:MAG: tyrosine-type recombinase/integrase [Solirubrobacteraceae bacterium]
MPARVAKTPPGGGHVRRTGRPATGQVLKPGKTQRSFALRVWAYGKREYITLGHPEDGWTLRQAERELQIVLRDIDLGVWKPNRPEPAKTENDPLFHEFASEWFATKQPELAANTARSYRNDLTKHLLPFFAEHTLFQITISEVDRYRQEKVHEAARLTAAAEEGKTRTVMVIDRRGRSYQRNERPLSNRSINMHLFLLAQILDVAADHQLIPSNPAKGKRRRLKVTKPRPVYLDSAEHIAVMLEAASELDRDSKSRTKGRRAAIALLMLGGPRASAAGALLGRDQDLANGRIEVGRDKTEAGVREIDMLPLLREILTEHKATNATAPDDPILTTRHGNARDRHNLRQRVVAPVVVKAEELLAQRGGQPLPNGITPHKLRHTFASVLFSIGKDPTYVMHQLGHTDPAFTLRVYAHMMRRSPEERAKLKALVEGHAWTLGEEQAEESAEQR